MVNLTNRARLGSSDLVEPIRLKILFHDIRPNGSISEEALADEFGVSRTPIREALVILQSDALVTIERKHGAYVRGNSLAAFKNFFEAANMIIPETLALAAVRRTEANLERMSALLLKAESIDGATDFRRRLLCFRSFVFEAGSACQNALLAQEARRFVDLHIFFRLGLLMSVSSGSSEQQIESVESHRPIYECILDRDAKKARAIGEARLQRTRDLMLNILS